MQISEINIYPIKSLKGISLESSPVEKRGLRLDRRWMLTDRDGIFITQRETPEMATIGVRVNSDGLRVTSHKAGEMNIPFEPDRGHRQEVTVWHSNVPGLVYNGEVSEWFSDALQRNCQLVLMPESTERHVSERFDQGKDIVSFADGYPLMLLGEGSLAELNHRIEEKYKDADEGVRGPLYKDADEGVRGPLYKDADEGVRGPAPLPMNRFRPNLVVRGSDPFEEDKWAKIRVGEAVFRVVKPCGRCVITTIDPARGEFDGKEPLKTLATFRMAKDVFPTSYGAFEQKPNAVLFGENLIPENPGTTITVGDEITVLEMRSSRK